MEKNAVQKENSSQQLITDNIIIIINISNHEQRKKYRIGIFRKDRVLYIILIKNRRALFFLDIDEYLWKIVT